MAGPWFESEGELAMYASFHKRDMTYADFFRDAAAASAVVLAAIWIGLVINEMFVAKELIPNPHSALQLLVLAVIFGAYVVGWRHGVLGATLAVLGTVALFGVAYWSVGILPPLAAAWFAVPGVLYLLAWYADRPRRLQRGSVVARDDDYSV